jgi:predicted ABC-type ATPase
MPWFLEQADRAWIYDNSGASPKLIAEKSAGVVTLDEDALPAIVEAVDRMRTERR